MFFDTEYLNKWQIILLSMDQRAYFEGLASPVVSSSGLRKQDKVIPDAVYKVPIEGNALGWYARTNRDFRDFLYDDERGEIPPDKLPEIVVTFYNAEVGLHVEQEKPGDWVNALYGGYTVSDIEALAMEANDALNEVSKGRLSRGEQLLGEERLKYCLGYVIASLTGRLEK